MRTAAIQRELQILCFDGWVRLQRDGDGHGEWLVPVNMQDVFVYHLGDANVWVSNISPHAGGVEYILHVDWNEPLPVAVTITLESNPPVETQNL